MKNDVMPSKVKMEYGLLQTLLTEVKETLATDIELPLKEPKKFGAVDLWKIRRNMKTAGAMFKG